MKLSGHNLREELQTWCASFPMQWRCELEWSEDQTEQQAWWLLFGFLKQLEDEQATKDFCWVAYPENLHGDGRPFQVFIGGLKKFGPRTQRKWEERWDAQTQTLCANICNFDPREVTSYTHQRVEKIAYDFRFRTPLRAVSDVLGVAE